VIARLGSIRLTRGELLGRHSKVSELTSRGSIRLEDARSELLSRVSEIIPSEFSAVVEKYFHLVAPVDIVDRNPHDLAAK
jgi:hypothetical protein